MEVPCRPWKVLGMDFFMHKSKWYLLVADYYSKFSYILQMASMTSKDVISAQRFCFSLLGTPEEIISDNETNFTSRDYMEFATNWGFILTTSSLHYPKGHGFIERQVQTIMKLFTRCDEDKTNYYLALQELWATPSTAIYHHQQSFSSTDSWKPHFQPSSGLHTTVKLSEHPSKPDRITAGTMPIPRKNLISYQPSQSGYMMQFPKDGTQAWSKPKQRHPSPTSSRHHKVNAGVTAHIWKRLQYQPQFQS